MKHKFKKVFAAAIGSVLMAGAAMPVVHADTDTTATMPASDLQHIKLVDIYDPEGIKDKPLQNASIKLKNYDPSQTKTFTTDKDGVADITAADFISADGKKMAVYTSGEWNQKGVTGQKGDWYLDERVISYDIDDGVLKYDGRNASVSADGHTLIIQAEPVKFLLKIKHVTADEDIPNLGALNNGGGSCLNYEIRDAAGNALTPTGSGETKYTVRWGERYTYHQIPDASDADLYANDFDFTPLYGDNTTGSQDFRYAAYYNLGIPTGHKVTLIESPRQNGTIDEIGLLRGKHTAYEAMVKNGGAEIKDADTGESFGGWRKRLVKNGSEVKLSNAVFPFTNPRLFVDANRPADATAGGVISWGEHEGPESSWGVLYKGDLKIYHFDVRWMDDDTNTIVGGNGTTYQILRKQGTTEKWMVAIPQVVGDDYTITLPTVSDIEGYTFDGWYTKQDGGTRLGGSGEQATLNYDGKVWDEMTDQDMDLMTGRMYGHWTKNPEYTIAYDGNGSTSGHMDAEIYKTDADVALTANGFTKDGYTFIGWATSADGDVVYKDKADIGKVSTVAVTDNKLTVYAQWQKNTVWDGLTVNKTVDKDVAKPGDTLTYTITVSNKTGKDLTDVTVSDALDSGLTFVSADSEAYSNGAWAIDSLKDGASATLTLKAKVNEDVADKAVIPNAASITGAHADDGNLPDDHHTEDEVRTTVNVPINWDGLTISKTVDKDTAKPGDTLTYAVTVSNKTGKDLTDIAVTDKLDDNLTYVSADNDGYNDGVWMIASLKNGESATLTLTAKVNDDVKDGTAIPNTAVITDAHNGDESLPKDSLPSAKVDVTVTQPETPAPEIHKVTYDGNGGKGTMDATVIADDGTVTLAGNKFTKDGYTFAGWATSPDGDIVYNDKAELTDQSADLTLYAVWEKVPDKAEPEKKAPDNTAPKNDEPAEVTPEKKSPDTGVHADMSVTYAGIGLVAGLALLLAVVCTAKHRKSE